MKMFYLVLHAQVFCFVFYRGDYDYELWLRNDLYTNKHTQWYYFRIENTRPNVKYRFTIVNLMKVREFIPSKHHLQSLCSWQNV